MKDIDKELSTILRKVVLFDEEDKLETELIENIKELFKESVPAETLVMPKPAGSADEIFIKGKIEGLEEARWQIVYALPHIDPNGKLEKQTKYLMDEFEKVKEELRAKL